MRLKRAGIAGILMYLSSFLVVGILSYLFNINSENTIPNISFLVLALTTTLALLLLFSLWYFKKCEANLKEGMFLGIVVAVSGSIIDTIVQFLSFLIRGTPKNVFENFGDIFFWCLLGILVIISAVVGWVVGIFKVKK